MILLLSTLFLLSQAQSNNVTDIPVIGILTQPLDASAIELRGTKLISDKKEFIGAHYPIYFGGAGAKIIPLSYSLPESDIRALMGKMNGLFITGGTADFAIYDDKKKEWIITPFGKASQKIIEIAIELNSEGKFFPVWGTCMGFQLLAFAISKDPAIPKIGCDCYNYNAELTFTPEAKSSKMFSVFTEKEMEDFTKRDLTFNNHQYYIDTKDFDKHKTLKDFFHILSFSKDKGKKLQFISAMEGKKYPFYGTQFHPEINHYSLANRIPGPENVELAQRFGNFFVREARKNGNKMERQEMLRLSIWNTPITKLGAGNFVYLFP